MRVGVRQVVGGELKQSGAQSRRRAGRERGEPIGLVFVATGQGLLSEAKQELDRPDQEREEDQTRVEPRRFHQKGFVESLPRLEPGEGGQYQSRVQQGKDKAEGHVAAFVVSDLV